MNKFFYSKLALNNIRKNSKTYFPYILTCISTIAMYYIMYALSINCDLPSANAQEAIKTILTFGIYVIAIFSVIFLFYTNSFLIKRRKKEFGIFNILGMEKKHISKILLLETTFISLFSLIIGIVLGILLNKLMYLFLLKILNIDVQMGFNIPLQALISTLILFVIIFTLIFLNSFRQIHLTNPIELLRGGDVGEKEPKTKWFMTIVGFLCLGIGYYISLTTKNPIQSLSSFFIAVILVIIGTYALFIAGSITVLKILRKNSKFYYKPNHFISVSGMIYRMKQNAAGLANICILSTMVLVMLSTTVCMYIGLEDSLHRQYPNDISISINETSQDVTKIDSIIEQQALSYKSPIKNKVAFKGSNLMTKQTGNTFEGKKSDLVNNPSLTDLTYLVMISLDDFNSLEKTNITLKDNELLIYDTSKKTAYNDIKINNLNFKIKNNLKEVKFLSKDNFDLMNAYFIVTPNQNIMKDIALSSLDNEKDFKGFSYSYSFDTTIDKKSQVKLIDSISKTLNSENLEANVNGVEKARESFLVLYGGLFFLGIFLGLLFIMATVLIIYYKQISEGYDDRKRFEIMTKVGMSQDEIKKSIRSQVLMVFSIPIITACIHIAFAFNVISKLLSLLVIKNTTLFMMCTIGTIIVFIILYAIVYSLTARVYYKIVSSK